MAPDDRARLADREGVAARRQRFVKQAGVMRYVSLANGAVYVEWGDGVMVHVFRRVGLRFKFKVWRIK